MATECYYAIDGVQYGPVSSQELKRLADSKRILPEHLVWRSGLKNWIKAENVNGLFTICIDASELLPRIPPRREKAIQIKLEAEGKDHKGLSASLLKQPKELPIKNLANPNNESISYNNTQPTLAPTASTKTRRFILAIAYCVVGGFLLLFLANGIGSPIFARAGIKAVSMLLVFGVFVCVRFLLKYVWKKFWVSRRAATAKPLAYQNLIQSNTTSAGANPPSQ
jgi:hypothetical protein